MLRALEAVRVVSDLRMPSDAVKLAHLKYTDEERRALQAPEDAIRGKARAPVSSSPAEKMREAIAAATEPASRAAANAS